MAGMTVVRVMLGTDLIHVHCEDGTFALPVGVHTVADGIASDPPRPEELTNAIGVVQDHLEDASREVPSIEFAQRVEVSGWGVPALAAVELGAPTPLPYELSREAAEDVFRTLVTERRAQRALNPGLPADMVHGVLGVASVLVATMRFLHCDTVWLVDE
jgi:exopolyphosphatase/guanosine-5'-triphosphate,3'-diphosphate pyrophosphatase